MAIIINIMVDMIIDILVKIYRPVSIIKNLRRILGIENFSLFTISQISMTKSALSETMPDLKALVRRVCLPSGPASPPLHLSPLTLFPSVVWIYL